MTEGSRLFLTCVLPDESHEGVSRQVWSLNPWMIDAWTGSEPNGRRRDMWIWCKDRWGPPSQPFGDEPKPGAWRDGNATVCGWTWWGFDTEAKMNEFLEAWPHPETVK